MRALVYDDGKLLLERRPDPEPERGDVVVRVLACGICGTDLRIAKGLHRAYAPGTRRVPGHEIAGEVEAVGDPASPLAVGERVFVAPNVSCGHCHACRSGHRSVCENAEALGITLDGGFAERVLVPEASVRQGNVLGAPAGVDPGALSVVEPLACVLRGQRAVGLAAADTALICGGGPIGLLHTMLARAAGADPVMVSEPQSVRRAQAESFGAVGIDPVGEDLGERVREITGGKGADVVITAVPVGAVQEQALELAAVGGRVNFFGGLPRDAARISFDSNAVHYKELLVTGTTANDETDCGEALALFAEGGIDLGRLVSARFPLDRAEEAFAAAAGGAELKVVIEP
ncbi:MAG: alcohol dehydrogenase catalytic domain-containing protein [Solirubrobacterales bacterium]